MPSAQYLPLLFRGGGALARFFPLLFRGGGRGVVASTHIAQNIAKQIATPRTTPKPPPLKRMGLKLAAIA
ncbi:MAG: hypothetical protein B7Y36_14285 [Novosphingobium sp. 28-62-57]|nr:MAG: hypothetical protein B7Z34_13825 [Novosphingobium sp. 12-62-10]OYZ09332.1 MAG: hypothetical protein B7Y36_14285 [Novosphingobium sp. 28-62-57]OYZ98732.1 MAG: hypothetical protein B7X96_00615 [Novosphingobium sp. 17-62-8]